MTFSEIYKSIGFKPVPGTLTKFQKITDEELNNCKLLKSYQTVSNKDLKIPIDEKCKAVSACLKSKRKDLLISKDVVKDHFLYLKYW